MAWGEASQYRIGTEHIGQQEWVLAFSNRAGSRPLGGDHIDWQSGLTRSAREGSGVGIRRRRSVPVSVKLRPSMYPSDLGQVRRGVLREWVHRLRPKPVVKPPKTCDPGLLRVRHKWPRTAAPLEASANYLARRLMPTPLPKLSETYAWLCAEPSTIKKTAGVRPRLQISENVPLDLQPFLADGGIGASSAGVPSNTMRPWPIT